MTANYSTREYREKLYDDLHVRLRDTAILMCAIFIGGSLSFLDQLCLHHVNKYCWNKNFDEKISFNFI